MLIRYRRPGPFPSSPVNFFVNSFWSGLVGRVWCSCCYFLCGRSIYSTVRGAPAPPPPSPVSIGPLRSRRRPSPQTGGDDRDTTRRVSPCRDGRTRNPVVRGRKVRRVARTGRPVDPDRTLIGGLSLRKDWRGGTGAVQNVRVSLAGSSPLPRGPGSRTDHNRLEGLPPLAGRGR